MKQRGSGISSAMFKTEHAMRTNVKKIIMKHFYFMFIIAFVFTIMFPLYVHAYSVPELIHYKFNNAGGSTVPNEAGSPVGTNPAPVLNQTIGGAGQFGSALIGTGGAANADYVNTGWATRLSSGGWTIALWLNNFDNNTSSGQPSYLLGDSAAGAFRCFLHGFAGAGNLILRGGGLTDVLVTGVYAAQPCVVHFVYDPAVPEIRAYLNGVLNTTVAQPLVNISGTGFIVGGYAGSANSGLPSGALLDEFRVYSRVLPVQEIEGTWNKELGCSDADHDTYGAGCAAGADCDDSNAAVHPGATEVCNDKDDNCNGQIDEGVTATFYRDADGDTYGDSDNTTQACTAPAGYVSNHFDVDDADPFYTNILPTCEVKVIPAILGRFVGEKEKTRSLLIIGEQGTEFGDNSTIKWESDAIDVVRTRVFFKRFMFMRATFNGAPLDWEEYRVLIGDCEGSIKWAK
jgi:hypothetical protein